MTVSDELPPWLHSDPGTDSLIDAVEAMLSPVRQLLDHFDDHLEPWLAPNPLLAWLTSTFGVEAGRHQRSVLAALAQIHDGWATRRGLETLARSPRTRARPSRSPTAGASPGHRSPAPRRPATNHARW
ncbi:hypothetical protein [Alloactinosynnema sp. L-07]|uniref:hypothetical protein n=1 Tax=Alloactinosynnema sp. L-07 TaxID=1653480 RepID=UPI00065F0285|nr:hypothetical protein [Alloactinosynnema sp. L-07]CRK56945.1 hypothetical protein [Alloactinosynnema sp. L-07]